MIEVGADLSKDICVAKFDCNVFALIAALDSK